MRAAVAAFALVACSEPFATTSAPLVVDAGTDASDPPADSGAPVKDSTAAGLEAATENDSNPPASSGGTSSSSSSSSSGGTSSSSSSSSSSSGGTSSSSNSSSGGAACAAPYADANCATYVVGTVVSRLNQNGREVDNWTCIASACADCGVADPYCSPGWQGCAAGVVWELAGACH